jgi:tripartite-type tricarboxylate transporter receptor subunit TctC
MPNLPHSRAPLTGRVAFGWICAVGCICLLLAEELPAHGQEFPTKPLHVLVGFAAGSGPDIQARIITQQLSSDLKQPFVAENRTGANGTIAARAVATAPPDGYTLLFSSSSIAPTPHIYKQLGYDTLTDLKPIATSGQLDGLFLLVAKDSPIQSVADLMSRPRHNVCSMARPGSETLFISWFAAGGGPADLNPSVATVGPTQ